MRWPNGGPPKLWVVIVNDPIRAQKKAWGDPNVVAFSSRGDRKAWLMDHYPTYSSHDVTLLEYVQKEKL